MKEAVVSAPGTAERGSTHGKERQTGLPEPPFPRRIESTT